MFGVPSCILPNAVSIHVYTKYLFFEKPEGTHPLGILAQTFLKSGRLLHGKRGLREMHRTKKVTADRAKPFFVDNKVGGA